MAFLSSRSLLRTNTARPRSMRLLLVVGLAALGVLLPVLALRGDEPLAKYFSELRSRRLFSLAERTCLDRLAQANFQSAKRADWVVELSRTFAEHATYAPAQEQEELWERALKVTQEFLQQPTDQSRRVLVEVQAALVLADQGNWQRWQAELFPDESSRTTTALATVAKAIAALRALNESLSEVVHRPQGANDAEPERLRPFELRALLSTVRYRLAAALLDQVELTPEGAAERVAALLEAEQWLEPLTQGVADDELTWRSQILFARAARLRGLAQRAALQLEALLGAGPAVEIRDQIVAEQVRLQLQAGQPHEAGSLLIAYARIRRPLSGELSFLYVRVLTEMAEIARARKDEALAREAEAAITRQVELVREMIGGYWSYRCELLAERAREERELGRELASLIRAARGAYHGGEVDTALDAYASAVALATRVARTDLAFDLAYTRASILLDESRLEEAATSFAELVSQFPRHARAADAHLLAAYALGRLYEERPTRSRRERYTESLVRHQQQFAGHPSAYEALWMLAQLEERRLQVSAALPLYAEIPEGHPRFAAAQVAISRCYEKILLRLRELGQPVEAWEKEAIDKLGQMLPRPLEDGSLDIGQAEIAWRLARILLEQRQPDYEGADRLLAWIFTSIPEPEPMRKPGTDEETAAAGPPADTAAWQQLGNAATTLRVISLAGQGRMPEAEVLLRQVTKSQPANLLPIVSTLSELVTAAPPEARTSLGQLQLTAALRLRALGDQLPPAEQAVVERCLAQAYLATGQEERALEMFAKMLAHKELDESVLVATAAQLQQCTTSGCLRKALETWQRVEKLRKAGSVPWFEARLEVARCTFALGDTDQCRKLLSVTRLLYPKLGNEELRARFAELEQECQAKRPASRPSASRR